MGNRCGRNRKRSKRRAIYCLVHDEAYLDSVSPKYPLFADQVDQLRQIGIGKRNAQFLIDTQKTVPLSRQWIEAFWCNDCQEKRWYHVTKVDVNCYTLSVAPKALWQRATGTVLPYGNPSVGEFSLRHSGKFRRNLIKDFGISR